jgi:tetratricopeptide (TPR) repeat protein
MEMVMAELNTLLNNVSAAGEDLDKAAAAREALVAALDGDGSAPAQAAVTEALYRLGLNTLLHKKDINAAMELFKRAAEKKQADWSPLARTSHALTLAAKGKHQQAVFELRKVTGLPTPNVAAATAQVFLAQVLRDMGAKPGEIEKADKERITALETLVASLPRTGPDRAHWMFMLAVAHREGGSRSECKRLLQEIAAMGADAGEPTRGMAAGMLKGM